MIPAQPELGEIVEDLILRDLPGAHMAVVVQYGHPLRRAVVELFRRVSVQQEIFIQECFHGFPSFPAPRPLRPQRVITRRACAGGFVQRMARGLVIYL